MRRISRSHPGTPRLGRGCVRKSSIEALHDVQAEPALQPSSKQQRGHRGAGSETLANAETVHSLGLSRDNQLVGLLHWPERFRRSKRLSDTDRNGVQIRNHLDHRVVNALHDAACRYRHAMSNMAYLRLVCQAGCTAATAVD